MNVDMNTPLAHHTFGPWREKQGTRVVAAESAWREPLKWDKAAAKKGERHRVFCASLADVFEGPETLPVDVVARGDLRYARIRLFSMIEDTPHLDWLFLTKRPQNVVPILREVQADTALFPERAGEWGTLALRMLEKWNGGEPPANVWLGTVVEDQATADARIPHLLKVPARVRFVVCEPLLEFVNLNRDYRTGPGGATHMGNLGGAGGIHWVIAGGKSGLKSKPMHPDWIRCLRDQCIAAIVPFYFVHWGAYVPTYTPDPLSDHQFPNGQWMRRVGNKAGGRLLDGREWNGIPKPQKG